MNSDDDIIGPLNIGNPQEISIKKLAFSIINMTKSSSKIVYSELPQDDPVRRRPDISLAMDILKWHPNFNLSIGLKNTIKYFKKII